MELVMGVGAVGGGSNLEEDPNKEREHYKEEQPDALLGLFRHGGSGVLASPCSRSGLTSWGVAEISNLSRRSVVFHFHIRFAPNV